MHAEVAEQVRPPRLKASARVPVQVELDVIAAIEVLNVIECPSGNIVLLERDVDGPPRKGSSGGRNHEEEADQ